MKQQGLDWNWCDCEVSGLDWLGFPMVELAAGHRYVLLTSSVEPCDQVDETNTIASLSFAGWENITVRKDPDGPGCGVRIVADWPAGKPTDQVARPALSNEDIGDHLPANQTLVSLFDFTSQRAVWPAVQQPPPAPVPGPCTPPQSKEQRLPGGTTRCVTPATPCPPGTTADPSNAYAAFETCRATTATPPPPPTGGQQQKSSGPSGGAILGWVTAGLLGVSVLARVAGR